MDLLDDVLAVDDQRAVPGIRSATCSTERFSETLMRSPRNSAWPRSASPDSSASSVSSDEGLVGEQSFE